MFHERDDQAALTHYPARLFLTWRSHPPCFLSVLDSVTAVPRCLFFSHLAWASLLSCTNFLVTLYIITSTFGAMSQAYVPVPHNEGSLQSHDDSSDEGQNEKWEWRSEKRSLRNLPAAHWTWIVQAAMLSASITLFVVSMCRQSTGMSERIPTTWCK